MYINCLGNLEQDKDIPEWWVSKPIKVTFLSNLKVTFIITEEPADNKFAEDVNDAIVKFLTLTDKDRLETTEYIIKNYEEFVESTGEEPLNIKKSKDIWKNIYPQNIYVSRRPYVDKKVYIQIMCECDWEEEHGLQIVFKEGLTLSRVSQQDGHITLADAYGKPEWEGRIV
jgi:hypothetical protein